MIVAGALIFSSCERDELFEREQYKNRFALLRDNNLSTNVFNIFAEVHDLDSIVSEGNLSAVCGGSLPTEKDINISIIEDEELFASYNTTNFGEDTKLYAKRIPRSMYDVASYNITIRSGERYGLMNMKMRLNGLSPDSVYFIPFRVNRFSSYEMNPERDAVLYRVILKNFYATSQTDVYYSARYKLDDVNMMGSKVITPVQHNSVRTMAGELPYGKHLDTINSGAIILTIAEDKSVQISSWKDLEVYQYDDDPDYPNVFQIVDDGFGRKYKTFLLRYDYIYRNVRYKVQEELRLEFREEINY
jgi:hypothetical protein